MGRRLVGQYVMATLCTHRRVLVVTLKGRVVKRVACPIREPRVPPRDPPPGRT